MFQFSNGDVISKSKLQGVEKKQRRNQRLWEWPIIGNDLSRIKGIV